MRATGQVTAGPAAGYDVAKFAVPSYCGAGCGPGDDQYEGRGGLRAEL